MNDQLTNPRRAREFSNLGVEFAAGPVTCGGVTLEPDQSKAYCVFDICYAWPVRTAYGAAYHPGTLANSHRSMLHQVFNKAHAMKAYDTSAGQDQIHRDHILGAIVGVEFAAPPLGGWKIDAKGGPHLRVAAVIHKQAEGVPKLLGEHLSGRHKYAVSQEVLYSMLDSGFVVETGVGGGTTATRELCARTTPEEFTRAGLSYVPVLLGADQLCPEELLNCYSFEQSRVTRDWQGQRVTVLKGGIAGRVHFQGVGLVRYGAEKEAQIQQILASDPDGLEAETDAELAAVLKIVAESSRNLLTAVGNTVLPSV